MTIKSILGVDVRVFSFQSVPIELDLHLDVPRFLFIYRWQLSRSERGWMLNIVIGAEMVVKIVGKTKIMIDESRD